MKIRNCHQRTVAAPPERIAALVSDFDRVWPAEIAPAPRPRGGGRYDAGLMLWEEFDRPGAARAFREEAVASGIVVWPGGARDEAQT